MGIFATGSPFENAMKDSAQAEAKRNKTSMWDNTLNTLFQVGVVAPVARGLAGEVGTAINRGAVEKHEDWLLSEDAAQTNLTFKKNRTFKNTHELDEANRKSNKRTMFEHERIPVAAVFVADYKERLQNPKTKAQLANETILGKIPEPMPYMPADSFSDATIEKFLEKEINEATQIAVDKKKNINKLLVNLKTEDQVNKFYRNKNPYGTTFIGGAFGTLKRLLGSKSDKEIHDASIKSLKEDEFYSKSKELNEAIKAYEEGADFQSIKNTVNKVVRSPEDLKFLAQQYRKKIVVEQRTKVVGKSIHTETYQSIENPLTKKTEVKVIGKKTIEAIPETPADLLDSTENLILTINRLGFTEIAKKNLLIELGNLESTLSKDGKIIKFNPINHKRFSYDDYTKAMKIVNEYTPVRANYKEYNERRASTNERVTAALVRNGIAGITILTDMQAPEPADKKSAEWRTWEGARNRATAKFIALRNTTQENDFAIFAAQEGVGYKPANAVNAVPIPGKEQEFKELRTEYYLGLPSQTLEQIKKATSVDTSVSNVNVNSLSGETVDTLFSDLGDKPEVTLDLVANKLFKGKNFEDLTNKQKQEVEKYAKFKKKITPFSVRQDKLAGSSSLDQIQNVNATEKEYLSTGKPLRYSMLANPNP